MEQFILYFFFFQAEDGIRDLYVTGVQTCALPIYEKKVIDLTKLTALVRICRGKKVDIPCSEITCHLDSLMTGKCESKEEPKRSEERRVGKECRSRWSRDHYKKKE